MKWKVGDKFHRNQFAGTVYRIHRIKGTTIWYLNNCYGAVPPRGVLRTMHIADMEACAPLRSWEEEQHFRIDCVAFILHRDDLNVLAIGDPAGLPWRGCVKCGGRMFWQWCKTQQEAQDWIDCWKKNS